MSPDHDSLSFEVAMDRLKEVVDQLEDDDLTLEEALEAYEEGMALAAHCQEQLEDAEVRIEEVSLDGE